MSRSLVLLLLCCLSARPAFAFNVNWPERVQRFSRYVDTHAIAQGQRTQMLGVQSKSFNNRVQGYTRALEAQARPFQNSPSTSRE